MRERMSLYTIKTSSLMMIVRSKSIQRAKAEAVAYWGTRMNPEVSLSTKADIEWYRSMGGDMEELEYGL